MLLSQSGLIRWQCVLLFSVALVLGCSDTEPHTTSGDELSNYLEQHPELAEAVEDDVDPAMNQE
ncbi:hypothetical protein [Aporhodopirellula aestuarii]|uniref:Secreted protein n=1 Tax=Aporhodopirellula aestuarii TaxID=2950107 RepID=A0ABT0U1B1_9BACT|nr:hypothetical protein [Aporhodopirellula aestuarii]MCM2370637.1 hypothetical protein [Aporhodopirellula aestuarii]